MYISNSVIEIFIESNYKIIKNHVSAVISHEFSPQLYIVLFNAHDPQRVKHTYITT